MRVDFLVMGMVQYVHNYKFKAENCSAAMTCTVKIVTSSEHGRGSNSGLELHVFSLCHLGAPSVNLINRTDQ